MRVQKGLVALLSAGVLFTATSAAFAGSFTFGTPIRNVNLADPQGLTENVYHLPSSFDAPSASPPSEATINTFVIYAANHSPTYSFVNTNDGFHWAASNDNTQTNTLFAADANGLGATDTSQIRTSIADAIGGLEVPVAGTYTFSFVGADDAARVIIGDSFSIPGTGTDVAELNYNGSVSTTPGTVNFTKPGVYSIEVFWFNQAVVLGGTSGGAGLTLNVTPPNGSSLAYTTSIPEPVGMGLIALAGMSGISSRRRR
jgi:hypothetical protein